MVHLSTRIRRRLAWRLRRSATQIQGSDDLANEIVAALKRYDQRNGGLPFRVR